MMAMHKPKRQHAILATGLLICCIIAFYFVLIAPAIQTRQKHLEEISSLQFQIEKITQRIANANSLQTKLKKTGVANNTNEQGFIFENNPSMAKASLQQMVSTLVKKTGGTLVSTHVTENTASGIFPELSIQLHMRSNIEALQKAVFDIERQNVSLFIRSISIQTIKRRNNNAGELDIRLKLSAFMNDSRTSS